MMKEMNLPVLSREEVQQKFDELDTDKSGKLGLQQFRVFTVYVLGLAKTNLEAIIASANN